MDYIFNESDLNEGTRVKFQILCFDRIFIYLHMKYLGDLIYETMFICCVNLRVYMCAKKKLAASLASIVAIFHGPAPSTGQRIRIVSINADRRVLKK